MSRRNREGQAVAKPQKPPMTRGLIIRRSIVITFMLAFAATAYYLLFFTDVLAPIWAQVPVVQGAIDWVVADPSRLFAAAAAFILPHLGLYEFLSGRRF